MKYFFSLLFFVLSILTTQGQAGKLDKSFGTNGIVITGEGINYCYAAAVQPDGKIIQAGGGSYSGIAGFFIIRYNADGSIDGGFGNEGRAVTDLPGDETIFAVGLQPDGKIVAAGYTLPDPNNVDIALARYSPDGILDSSFGENGIIISSIKTFDYLTAMAIQPDGKIVVTGITLQEDDQRDNKTSFTLRYLPDGSPDAAFGDNGRVLTVFAQAIKINAIALLPNNKIVIGGTYSYLSGPRFMLVRYEPDGNIDKSFGVNGIAKAGFGDDYINTRLHSISLQADAKIVGGGETGKAFESAMALIRFNSDGTVDNSFGMEGTALIDFGTSHSDAYAVLVQTDGKIIAAGNYLDESLTYNHFALARCLDNGNPDSSFGKNGLVVTDVNGGERCNAAALQPDGKILLAGDTYISNLQSYQFALARYNAEGVLAITNNDFTARQTATGILLNWQSTQETNNTWVAVERSANSIAYMEIARIKSQESGTITQQYSYTDKVPLAGENYYRLKQADKDGSFSYSKTIHISYTATERIRLYPNPAHDLITIDGLNASEINKLTIYDLQGRILQKFSVQAGQFSFSVNRFAAGTYMLRLQNSKGTSTYKFEKK